MTQNIIITNQYNVRAVTCELHRSGIESHIVGATFGGTTDDECPECLEDRRKAELPGEVRAALLSKKLSHTRARNFGGGWSVYVYHRDDSSPTGVLLATSIDKARFDSIYAELRQSGVLTSSASPLSPTEGLRA